MTNREYLATLDSNRVAEWVLHDAADLARMSTQSLTFLAEWLDEEYDGWITISERSRVMIARWKEESEGADDEQ